MNLFWAFLAGTLTGVLSGLGVGGGSLLILCLTSFFSFSQQAAQGINLLYFLPTASAATVLHLKNGLVEKKLVLPAILAGLITAVPASLLATMLDSGVLRKLFGVLVVYLGLRELFGNTAKT